MRVQVSRRSKCGLNCFDAPVQQGHSGGEPEEEKAAHQGLWWHYHSWKINRYVRLTPKFSCKHSITIVAKPHPKSACLLQRSLGGRWTVLIGEAFEIVRQRNPKCF